VRSESIAEGEKKKEKTRRFCKSPGENSKRPLGCQIEPNFCQGGHGGENAKKAGEKKKKGFLN